MLTLEHTRQSAFGPVHPRGVGVAYHVHPAALAFCVSAYAPHDAHALRDELRRALDHVGTLLGASDEEPTAPRAAL